MKIKQILFILSCFFMIGGLVSCGADAKTAKKPTTKKTANKKAKGKKGLKKKVVAKNPLAVNNLKKRLKLSDAQVQKIQALNKSNAAKLKAIPKVNGKPNSAKVKQLSALKTAELKKIMTPDQYKQYLNIKCAMAKRAKAKKAKKVKKGSK